MEIEQIRKDYATQDNRATSYPIYVEVQEMKFIGVFDEDYSPFGDGEIRYFYKHPHEDGCDEPYENKEDLIEWLREYLEESGEIEELEDQIEDIEELQSWHMYVTVEVFFTLQAADKFIEEMGGRLDKPRTWTNHFHRGNQEVRTILEHAGFITSENDRPDRNTQSDK